MSHSRQAAAWFEVTPFNTTQDLWVEPTWEGKPKYGRSTLDDGQEIDDLIARGDLDRIPFPVWFERNTGSSGKRQGDLLWDVGLPTSLVSRRFADAVGDLGVTGTRTYGIELIDRRNGPIEGYVGFVPRLNGSGEVSSYAWTDGDNSFTWIISARVLLGLKERGVDMFSVQQLKGRKRVPQV